MKFHSSILAGTALGLCMATMSIGGLALAQGTANQSPTVRQGLAGATLLAQADPSGDPEQSLKDAKKARKAARQEKKQQQLQKQAPQAQQRPAQQQPVQAEVPAIKPDRKHRQPAEAQAPAPKAEQKQQPVQADQSQSTNPVQNLKDAKRARKAARQERRAQKKQLQKQAPQAQQRPAQQQPVQAEVPAIKPDRKHRQPAEAQAPAPKAEQKQQPVQADQNQSTNPVQNLKDAKKARKAARQERRAQKEQQQQAPQAETPKAGQPAAHTEGAQPAKPGEKPRQPAEAAKPANGQAEGNMPQNASPVLDSEKRHGGGNRADRGNRGKNGNLPGQNDAQGGGGKQPVNAGPPPKSDAAAQTFRRPGKLESIDAERGKRIKGDQRPRRERPNNAEVVKEIGTRLILNLGGQTIVQGSDQPRLRHDARDVYYEDLPRNRRRETIERVDGSRIVTIRDEYGDVVRRSRFTPDGHEIRLVYVDDQDLGRERNGGRGWRDPGEDLPPLRLGVPVRDYILDFSRSTIRTAITSSSTSRRWKGSSACTRWAM